MIPVRVSPTIKPHIAARSRTIDPDHPLACRDCPVCDEPLREGPISLVLVGRSDLTSWTAAAVAVHTSCSSDG